MTEIFARPSYQVHLHESTKNEFIAKTHVNSKVVRMSIILLVHATGLHCNVPFFRRVYRFWSFRINGSLDLFENRISLNNGLGGVNSVARDIAVHNQTQ